jgi:serine/threonine protein kinase
MDYNFPKNEKISESAIDLIKKLLQKNPKERLGSNSRNGLSL